MDNWENTWPSFCKVLFRDFSNNLLIPPAFVKHLDRTPANIILQVPDKGSWPVDIKFAEGELFFQNGWSSFAQDNSLQHGDFLIFSYVDSAKFIVRIYGMSGCEKDLAFGKATKRRHDPPTNHNEQNQKEWDDQLHEKGDERLSSPLFPSELERKKTDVMVDSPASEFVSRFKQKRRKIEETRKQMNQPSKGNIEKNSSKEISRSQPIMLKASPSVSKVIVERERSVRATAAASEFYSKYPFFKMTTRPSYVKYKCLSLPTPFYSKYMEGVTDITLEVSNKSWPVKMSAYAGRFAKLYRGWSTFLRENDVNVGDVCAFELIKMINASHFLFKFSIFKLTGN